MTAEAMTSDGRRVQLVYTGNVVEATVEEAPGSRYARVIGCYAAGFEPAWYLAKARELAGSLSTVEGR